jgi:hypothetical protein
LVGWIHVCGYDETNAAERCGEEEDRRQGSHCTSCRCRGTILPCFPPLASDLLAKKSSSAPSVDPEELERIRKRQAGQAVTIEAFMEWKMKFEAEMLALKIAQHGAIDKDKDDRPTGKQLFLSNRAGLEEALIAAGEQETSAQLAAAMTAATRRAAAGEGEGMGEEGIAVKEDLFLEDCDDLDDLDDLLDDDEDDEDYEESDGEEEDV